MLSTLLFLILLNWMFGNHGYYTPPKPPACNAFISASKPILATQFLDCEEELNHRLPEPTDKQIAAIFGIQIDSVRKLEPLEFVVEDISELGCSPSIGEHPYDSGGSFPVYIATKENHKLFPTLSNDEVLGLNGRGQMGCEITHARAINSDGSVKDITIPWEPEGSVECYYRWTITKSLAPYVALTTSETYYTNPATGKIHKFPPALIIVPAGTTINWATGSLTVDGVLEQCPPAPTNMKQFRQCWEAYSANPSPGQFQQYEAYLKTDDDPNEKCPL